MYHELSDNEPLEGHEHDHHVREQHCVLVSCVRSLECKRLLHNHLLNEHGQLYEVQSSVFLEFVYKLLCRDHVFVDYLFMQVQQIFSLLFVFL